jgi:hypothetical protein
MFACSLCRRLNPLSQPTRGGNLDGLNRLWKVEISAYPDSTEPPEVCYTLQERSISEGGVERFVREIMGGSKEMCISPKLIGYDFD